MVVGACLTGLAGLEENIPEAVERVGLHDPGADLARYGQGLLDGSGSVLVAAEPQVNLAEPDQGVGFVSCVAHFVEHGDGLSESFLEWIHEPGLFRSLADSPVRMRFIAAGNDIRPDWPLRQLAELVPAGSFELIAGVDHSFWTTDPERWIKVVTEACTQL